MIVPGLGGMKPSALARRLWDVFFEYRTVDLAAQLGFYSLLSLFPFAMLIGTVVAHLPIPGLLGQINDLIRHFAPRPATPLLEAAAENVLAGGGPGLLIFGALGTIVTASSGVAALTSVLNHAYGVRETRSWLRVQLRSIVITVAGVLLVVVGMSALLIGPALVGRIADWFGLGPAVALVWSYARFVAAVGALGVLLALLYWACPNVKAPLKLVTPGSVVAVPVWVLATLGLNLYFAALPTFNRTYGALGAGVALLLWLQVSSLVVIVGGEMNGIVFGAGERGG